MKKFLKKNDDALTDIVGTVLLLLIAVSLFSVLYYFVYTVDAPDDNIHLNMLAYSDGNIISLDHWGGDPINVNDASIILIVNGVRNDNIELSTFHFSNQKTGGRSDYWEIGERLYKDVSVDVGDIFNSDTDLELIDEVNNMIIMSGNINRMTDNHAPYTPSNPKPTGTGVSLCSILTWQGGDPDGGSVKYDVYFGTDSTPDETELVSNDQTSTTYNPGLLNPSTTYYWKITSEDSFGLNASSPIWDFTTATGNIPPKTPSNPNPSNESISVSKDTVLSWMGGDGDPCDSVTYDVYFGTDETPVNLVSDDQIGTSYDPIMVNGTTYYWKIIADDGEDTTEGPIWWFTTATGPNNWPVISNPSPYDGETGLNLSPILSVVVSDLDLDNMDVTFYDASDDSIIGTTQTGVSNGSTVTQEWSGLSYFTTYSWYVTVDDGTDITISDTWSFMPGSFFDSFESDNLNIIWTENEDNWYRSTQRATDGSWSVEVDGYNGMGTTILTMADSIDLSGYTNATLFYDWYIDTDWDDGEYISIEFWDGSTWNEITRIEGNINEGNWLYMYEYLSGYLIVDFKIRFIASVNGSNEDGNIDNIRIIGT